MAACDGGHPALGEGDLAQRELGSTGLKAFPLGLGTVKIGRNRDVKYPAGFELPDDAAVDRLLSTALDLGIDFIDTAPAYGSSEERLGPFVAAHRDRIVLCSKAGEDWGPDGSSHDFSADGLVRSVEASLRRLRTDHLDVLLLHSDGTDAQIFASTDALEGLRRIRESGKARAVGLSAKTVEGVEFAARELDVVMAPFGIAHPELGPTLARARATGCGTLVIKVLGQGHAVAGDEDPVQAAMDHVLRAEGIDLAVIGTIDPAHLAQAVERARQSLDALR
jgi:aryl-alcohol dehydrogenase-like predicted oxidoreductase